MSKEIRLTLTRKITNGDSEAMFGSLEVPGLGVYTSLERHWNNNIPGKSAVPVGFYVLVPHHGAKYKDTFALIGDTVAHAKTEGVPRYACVLHWEDDGVELQGCIALGDSMDWRASNGRSKLKRDRLQEVLTHLRGFDRVLLTIVEE